MRDQDKILNFLKFAGPTLPSKVAKNIKQEILITSAHLADLKSQGKIKISDLKVGGSPLYYLPGQEYLLYDFAAGNINPKDLEVLNRLKEIKVMREDNLELLAKVALRSLKDFAIPLHVIIGNRRELFWKWHLLSAEETNQIIGQIIGATTRQQEISVQKQQDLSNQVFQQEVQELNISEELQHLKDLELTSKVQEQKSLGVEDKNKYLLDSNEVLDNNKIIVDEKIDEKIDRNKTQNKTQNITQNITQKDVIETKIEQKRAVSEQITSQEGAKLNQLESGRLNLQSGVQEQEEEKEQQKKDLKLSGSGIAPEQKVKQGSKAKAGRPSKKETAAKKEKTQREEQKQRGMASFTKADQDSKILDNQKEKIQEEKKEEKKQDEGNTDKEVKIENEKIENEKKEQEREGLEEDFKENKKPFLQKVKEKIIRRKNKKVVDDLFPQVENYFKSLEIKVEKKEIVRKNFEMNLLVNISSVVGDTKYFCKVKSKAKCDEKDVSTAYMESQIKKLPLLFVYTNELTKKAEEMLKSGAFENVIVKRLDHE